MRNLRLLVTSVQSGVWYTLLVIVLALISLGFLVYEWLPGAEEEIIMLGDEIDLYVAYVFLLDFLMGLGFNTSYRNTRHYWRENWLNLVSSIPVTSEFTQALRVLRVLRAVRVLKVVLNVWTAKQQLEYVHSVKGRRRR
jgi:type II secretory pathway component PulF